MTQLAMTATAPLLRAAETPRSALVNSTPDAASWVRGILSLAEEQLDDARARLAFERIIDPSIDAAATTGEIDRMAEVARDLAGKGADDGAKLAALRKLVYESGPWNDDRPFEYDHDNRFDIRAKLLAAYLETRRGNCVSMPILFLILAEKLGFDMALAQAPGHYFVRYKDLRGRILNLETTSGAHPAREAYFREHMLMSDRALANGIYMRSLPRREAIAAMAGTIVEHLMESQRYVEAAEVAETILQYSPNDVHAMLCYGAAHGELSRVEFAEKYAMPILIPAALQPRYQMLAQRNHYAFQWAEELGWQETKSPIER